jgi:hypothetical protein
MRTLLHMLVEPPIHSGELVNFIHCSIEAGQHKTHTMGGTRLEK